MPSHLSSSAKRSTAFVPVKRVGRRRLSARRLNRLSRATVAPRIPVFEPDFRFSRRLRSGVILVVMAAAAGLIICAVVALGTTAGVVAVNRTFTSTTTTTP